MATPIIGRKMKTKGSSKHPHLDGVAAPSIVPDRRHRERAFLFAKYVQRITACQRKSIQSIVECGRLLVPDAQPLLPGTIIAELTGDDVATAEGYIAKAPAPVLALCRILLNAGFDPARPLIAYRGPVLALRVRSISEGASLVVKSDTVGTPRFRKTPAEIPDAAPHEHLNG